MSALGGVLEEAGFEPESNAARLLSYVVIETIEGRAKRIKALTIAQDVFGRGGSFDPSTDSLVRVEMKRLREALKHHYETIGSGDPVRIDIPKGSYVPEFTRQVVDASPAIFPTFKRTAACLLAVVFGIALTLGAWWYSGAFPADVGDGEPRISIESAVAGDRTAQSVAFETLTRFRTFTVLGDSEVDDYRLSLNKSDGVFDVMLVHSASGEVVASAVFLEDMIGDLSDADAPSPFRVWLGRTFARNGIVDADFFRRGEAKGDMVCSQLTEDYFSTQTDARHLAARNCIFDRLDAGHNSARLQTDLALLTREEYLDQRNLMPGDPLDRAARAARDAISLDRFDSQAHYALMTVLFLSGSVAEAIAAGERALRLNPFDGEAIGGLAARLNAVGEHHRAITLFDRSRVFVPGGVKWRDYGYFLAYFGLGDMDRAATAGLALRGLTDNPLYAAALAISRAEVGDLAEASALKKVLLHQEPDPRAMYARRAYSEDLILALMARLDAIH